MNKRRTVQLAIFIIGSLLITTHRGEAQQYADTFYVTIADKTPEHPHYGEGYPQGYVVNGEQSPTVYMVRGKQYLWNTDEVPLGLVFDFYTLPIGGGLGFYREHVYEHIVSQGLWFVQPTNKTPDTLYYASSDQPWMGGTILIVDSIPTSVEAERERWKTGGLAGVEVTPNPFSEGTRIRYQVAERSEVVLEVVDVTGRVVVEQSMGTQEQGAHSVGVEGSKLRTGVYYYRLRATHKGTESVSSGMLHVLR